MRRLLARPLYYYIDTLDFDEELTVYECAERGIPLVGNYLIVQMKNGFKDRIGGRRKATLITKGFLEKDDRLFQPEFNIHHNLMIGIKTYDKPI